MHASGGVASSWDAESAAAARVDMDVGAAPVDMVAENDELEPDEPDEHVDLDDDAPDRVDADSGEASDMCKES